MPFRGGGFPAALALCALLGLAGCESKGPVAAADSFPEKIGRRLYRNVLDGRPGILLFAASDTALTLAYDTTLCGLYQAWKGPIGLGHPAGPVYHTQTASRIWTLRNGEDTLAAQVRYLGFSEDSTGYVAFRYALVTPKGDTVKVTEEPSFDDHYGDNALRRDFHFTGIPYGATVSLALGGKAGQWPERWEQSAGGLLLDSAQVPAGATGGAHLDIGNDDVSSTKVRWLGSAAP
jgi:hypothetical protein